MASKSSNEVSDAPSDSEISTEEFEAFYQPKQILFLSADLVGSTALKQKKRIKEKGVYIPDTREWAEAIQLFYSELTRRFRENWQFRINETNDRFRKSQLGSEPILWKTIGDELIFRKHISHTDQVARTINSFVRSIKSATIEIRKVMENEHIEIKCTAWLAEFPIQNKILLGGQFSDLDNIDPNRRGNLLRALKGYESTAIGSGFEIDFVGPGVDIGFRLTKHATSRKFVMSLDAAYLYLKYSDIFTSEITKLNPVRFERSIRLDGVMGGVPYPIFWIDMGEDDTTDRLEDKLLKPVTLDIPTAISYCDAFYAERRNYVDRPFIYEERDRFPRTDERSKPPTWHQEFINSYRDSYRFESDLPLGELNQ